MDFDLDIDRAVKHHRFRRNLKLADDEVGLAISTDIVVANAQMID